MERFGQSLRAQVHGGHHVDRYAHVCVSCLLCECVSDGLYVQVRSHAYTMERFGQCLGAQLHGDHNANKCTYVSVVANMRAYVSVLSSSIGVCIFFIMHPLFITNSVFDRRFAFEAHEWS